MLVRAERLFAPTHLAPPFNPALESLRPRNLPVCRLGVKSLVGAARAFWTNGRGGAGAVRVSGGHVRAVWSARRSSLWGHAAAPEGGAAKRAVRGASHTGMREPASVLRCTWALVVQLLLHCCGASPSSPRTRARRARKQTSEQREDPKEWHGRWGAGRWAVEGRWQRCNDTFEARRPGGWGRKRSGHFA